MTKLKGLSLGTFLKRFSSEAQCRNIWRRYAGKLVTFAQNAATVTDIGCPTDDASVPNDAIKFQWRQEQCCTGLICR